MDTTPHLPELLTLQEVMRYLKVSRWTLYRLITKGYLPAAKVQGRWRFKLQDVQAYIAGKLHRYGAVAKRDYVFNPDVLKKYRADSKEYYVQDEAFHGRVGSVSNRYLLAKARSTAWATGVRKVRPGKDAFNELHYCKITLPDGRLGLTIDRRAFQNLPQAEQDHWLSYLIDAGFVR